MATLLAWRQLSICMAACLLADSSSVAAMTHFLNLVILLSAAVVFHSPRGRAFVPSETVAARPSKTETIDPIPSNTLLSSSRPPPEEPLQDDNNEIPQAADIRQFLNQCAIQSFLFLLTQTRDPHTIKWVDSFTRPTMGPYGSERD